MKPHELDGQLLSSADGQQFEVWEPRWWQIRRWVYWWRFRRHFGFVMMFLHPGKGPSYQLKVRTIPTWMAALSDVPR